MAAISACAVLVASGLSWFTKHYLIGVDDHKLRCLPYTMYLIQKGTPHTVQRGDYLSFVNEKMDRFYPHGYPFVKLVRGIPGDKVEIKNDVLFINGNKIERLFLHDKLKVPAGTFDTVYTLQPRQYFVMGTFPRAYDSRYWGPISEEKIIGKARPLF